jgi:hypothetical protein
MSTDNASDNHESAILKYLTLPVAAKLLLGYFALYLALAYFLPFVHRGLPAAGQFGDMFGVVNAFASGLAMVGVAIAVWLQREQVVMQAAELKEAMQQAKQQTAALNAQLAAAQSQMQLEQKAYVERNKPSVYLDRREDPERRNHSNYVAHNAGGGFAINVFVFDVTLAEPGAIGSLGSGEERVLPLAINEALQDGAAGKRHLVVAEAPYTRTTQWTATLNLRTSQAGAHRGQILHAHASLEAQPPRGQHQTLRDYMTANRESFHKQLSELSEEGLGPRRLPEREE